MILKGTKKLAIDFGEMSLEDVMQNVMGSNVDYSREEFMNIVEVYGISEVVWGFYFGDN